MHHPEQLSDYKEAKETKQPGILSSALYLTTSGFYGLARFSAVLTYDSYLQV